MLYEAHFSDVIMDSHAYGPCWHYLGSEVMPTAENHSSVPALVTLHRVLI